MELLSSSPAHGDSSGDRRARGVAMLADAAAEGQLVPVAARKLLTAAEQVSPQGTTCVLHHCC